MKSLFVINTHSFVDLITNSSSELFVCNTNKSIESIKEILKSLLETHTKVCPREEITSFESCFGNIFIPKYTWNYYIVPEKITDALRSFEPNYRRDRYFGEGSYYNAEEEKTSEQIDLEYEQRLIETKYDTNVGDLYNKNKKKYDRLWKLQRSAIDELWTDWGARHLQVQFDLFVEFLNQNKFTEKQIASAKKSIKKAINNHRKEKRGQYPWARDSFNNKELNEAFEVFTHWHSWGIQVRANSIFIESVNDNSIPYEMFGSLESYLSAKRYHLG